jgi:hypothetical protein
MPLSESDASDLLNQRIKFKLFAAEQELESLRELEKSGITISSTSDVPRVMWEIKIECILAHLVGSVDSLLIWVNNKLSLGFDISRIDSSSKRLGKINDALKANGKSRLLDPLNKAVTPLAPQQLPGWFWTLKELRNQGMYRELIKLNVAVGGKSNIFRLVTKPQTNLEIIPYLEDSLSQTRN